MRVLVTGATGRIGKALLSGRPPGMEIEILLDPLDQGDTLVGPGHPRHRLCRHRGGRHLGPVPEKKRSSVGLNHLEQPADDPPWTGPGRT